MERIKKIMNIPLIHEHKWVTSKFFRFWMLENKAPEFHIKSDEEKGISPFTRFVKNPYLRVFIVLLMVTASTSIFFGWQMIYSMMLDDGIFIDLCPKDSLPPFDPVTNRWKANEMDKPCKEQHEELKRIYGYYSSAEFIFGVAAGYSLDYGGPLLTGFLGFIISSIAFLLFNLSEKNPNLLFTGGVLLGGSCNLLVFPALSLADYFPKYEGLVTASIIAIQNGGTIVPVFMRMLYDKYPSLTFRSIMDYYYLSVVFPLGILYLFNLPLVRYVLNPLYHNKSSSKDSTTEELPLESIEEAKPLKEYTEQVEKRKTTFLSEALSLKYGLFLCIVAIFTAQFNVYGLHMTAITPRPIINYLGYITPATSILGIAFGFVLNYTGSLPISIFISILTAIIFILIQFNVNWLQYAAATLYILGVSVVYSIKFTYVEENFLAVNQGKLLSILSLVSGLSALLSTEVEFSELNKEFIVLAISSIITFGISVFLLITLRNKKNY